MCKFWSSSRKNEKIDFVVMWVDPNDPEWQAEKSKYAVRKNADSSFRRYRDWDNLRYWFRGIEKYAPWVNKIYFVTYGHVPMWLNVNHPKLKIVKHSDFIPKKYLPTFSANPIEMNLHRIKGLSENFVFFNDDFFLINPTKATDFFKNNLPCDSACMCVYIHGGSTDVVEGLFSNDMKIINDHFSPRQSLKKDFLKWFNFKNGKYLYNNIIFAVYDKFVGIHFLHLPASFKKSTYKEVWNEEFKKLDETCRNKFRSHDDVNQWLIKYWQNCKGEFAPRNVNWGKYYDYNMGYAELNKLFGSKKYKAICINDTVADDEFENAKNITNRLFERKFPSKSEFEK